MMKMIKHGIKRSLSGMLILLVAVATLARCGGDEQQIEELTKEEAEKIGKSDWGDDDFCEIYGWYDDGICDTFCPRPDPDCEASEGESCEGISGKICKEGLYCGNFDFSSGECLIMGACVQETDCEHPDNEWSHSDCQGSSSCEVGKCKWTCDNTGPQPASCKSEEAPQDLPLQEKHISCVTSSAVLHPSKNFDDFELYFGGTHESTQEAWRFSYGIAIRQDGQWTDAAGSSYFTELQDESNRIIWHGITETGLDVRLEMSKSVHPGTGLRCAHLDLGDDTFDLTCNVNLDQLPRRGLCEPFTYPGEGVLYDRGSFLVSFLETPEREHVEDIMARISGSQNVKEVETLSDGPEIYAYGVRFHEDVSFDAFHDEVTLTWCPLATDLRVDYDHSIR